jgi:general secretion pathway protein I
MMAGRANTQRGFSLLEMLVALVIMAFSLGMLYQASGGTVRNVDDIELQQRAVLLARSVLQSRDSVPATGWSETGDSAGLRWQVSSSPYPTPAEGARAPQLHHLQVVVAWTGRRGAQQLTLESLLPQARPAAGAAR